MKEFELIKQFFQKQRISRHDVDLGIGDDCALVSIPNDHHLAITTDTLVEGVHFFNDIPPKALGHRVLAVNLSDLAAMGAEPTWISIGLTLPKVDPDWVEQFTSGLHETAEYFNVQIIGGDTTQGPLSITVCAKGLIPKGKAVTRSGAKVGDWVYVTGTLGDAGLAIEAKKNSWNVDQEHLQFANNRFLYPSPRVAAGQALRGLATSAIDISDGLIADMSHILALSNVGAIIHAEKIPVSESLLSSVNEATRLQLSLSYGDDYELLYTVSDENKHNLAMKLKQYGVKPECIGQIVSSEEGLQILHNGHKWVSNVTGFEHFK